MRDLLQQQLIEDYGLHGELTELYSYQDDSYLLTTEVEADAHLGTPSGPRYVVKVMHAQTLESSVTVQTDLLDWVAGKLTEAGSAISQPPGIARVIRTRSDQTYTTLALPSGEQRIVWIVSYLDGVLAAHQQPITVATISELGRSLAILHKTMRDFKHPGLERDFSWKLSDTDWIAEHRMGLQTAYPEHANWLNDAIDTYLKHDRLGKTALLSLEAQPIHGDINEHNVVFSRQDGPDFAQSQTIAGIIDFGDAHTAPRVCDVAIAATYFMMNQPNPWRILEALLRGYHSILSLTHQEQELLMPLVRLRIAQSLTHSMLRGKQEPNSDYLLVSQRPALELIDRLKNYRPPFAAHWVQYACNSDVLERKQQRLRAAIQEAQPAQVLGSCLKDAPVLDLSPGSGHPADPFSGDMPEPDSDADQTRGDVPTTLGRYGEPRLVYQSAEFRSTDHPASDARTFHAGVDVFARAGTPVFAPLKGTVHAIDNRTARQDYGPVVVLKHTLGDDTFFTLYGHLDSECLERLTPGMVVAKGERVAAIGAPPENGDWPPHLHFQWVLENYDWGTDINGVCYHYDWPAWKQVFPNPGVLLSCADEHLEHVIETDDALALRRQHSLGGSLAVSYHAPVQAVRGWQQYLYDQNGRCFLDAYNNVPHVGHCHPDVVSAVTRQLSTLSTNTRYLHTTILEYAERLTAHFDDHLSVCYIVNSASEANELALRLARSATNARDLIVMQDAYHGHTTSLIDISPYKAEGRGGQGCPDWVHQLPAVDLYRGAYRYGDADAAEKYASDVKSTIERMTRPLCGFICESLPSVGGQLVYPKGYLKRVYKLVREAGGVCIADEVQTGFGRTGDHFWGFEQQEVDPDVVVLGKPIGNGFPLAAVITTQPIADRFNNGMEFFSTFGGNTVACAAGLAVLEVVEKSNLQSHIKDVGDYLIDRLRQSLGTHHLVGDIRGMGLFLGIELVTNKQTLAPATRQASYVKNRLREEGVLIGTDGPHDNVLKIRPPAPFNRSDADFLVKSLAHVLDDTCLRA